MNRKWKKWYRGQNTDRSITTAAQACPGCLQQLSTLVSHFQGLRAYPEPSGSGDQMHWFPIFCKTFRTIKTALLFCLAELWAVWPLCFQNCHLPPSRILSAAWLSWSLLQGFSCCHQTPEAHGRRQNIFQNMACCRGVNRFRPTLKPPTCHDANHEAAAVMPGSRSLIDVNGTACAQNGELRPSEVQSPGLHGLQFDVMQITFLFCLTCSTASYYLI